MYTNDGISNEELQAIMSQTDQVPPKKKRGRPPKVKKVEDDNISPDNDVPSDKNVTSEKDTISEQEIDLTKNNIERPEQAKTQDQLKDKINEKEQVNTKKTSKQQQDEEFNQKKALFDQQAKQQTQPIIDLLNQTDQIKQNKKKLDDKEFFLPKTQSMVQNYFLHRLRQDKVYVEIETNTGSHFIGNIIGFDEFTVNVFVESTNYNSAILFFKSGLTYIRMLTESAYKCLKNKNTQTNKNSTAKNTSNKNSSNKNNSQVKQNKKVNVNPNKQNNKSKNQQVTPKQNHQVLPKQNQSNKQKSVQQQQVSPQQQKKTSYERLADKFNISRRGNRTDF